MTPAVRAALEAALTELAEGEAKSAVLTALAEFEPTRVDAAGRRAADAAKRIDPRCGF